jgi:hypothetical protein
MPTCTNHTPLFHYLFMEEWPTTRLEHHAAAMTEISISVTIADSPLFTGEFLETIASVGVESVKLPPRSPNLNAYEERFVRGIKESCLVRVIFFGEGALRKGIDDCVRHYHGERTTKVSATARLCPMKAKPAIVEQCCAVGD